MKIKRIKMTSPIHPKDLLFVEILWNGRWLKGRRGGWINLTEQVNK